MEATSDATAHGGADGGDQDQRNMHDSKFITFKYKNQNQMHRKHYLHALVVLLGISWGTSKALKS